MGGSIGDGRELRSTGQVLPLDLSGGYMRTHFLIHFEQCNLTFCCIFLFVSISQFKKKLREKRSRFRNVCQPPRSSLV